MDFNKNEKIIVVAILIAIMEADGIIDPNETAFLDNIIHTFCLSESDLDMIDELDLTQVISEFKTFPDDKRQYATGVFLDMAKCDGFAHPRELEIIENLGK